jgi:hypothetical protein
MKSKEVQEYNNNVKEGNNIYNRIVKSYKHIGITSDNLVVRVNISHYISKLGTPISHVNTCGVMGRLHNDKVIPLDDSNMLSYERRGLLDATLFDKENNNLDIQCLEKMDYDVSSIPVNNTLEKLLENC